MIPPHPADALRYKRVLEHNEVHRAVHIRTAFFFTPTPGTHTHIELQLHHRHVSLNSRLYIPTRARHFSRFYNTIFVRALHSEEKQIS